MKSSIIADKEKIDIIERAVPRSDGHKVVIKVAYAGVCGSDLHYWHYGDSWAKGWIMGHEFTGYVEDPGDRTDLKKGDRVICMPSKACTDCEFCNAGLTNCCEAPLTDAIGIGTPGGFAEYVMVRSHLAIKLEDHVPFEDATVVEPAAVGLAAANKSQVGPKDSVLVVGGGIIGLMSAMWARKAGAKQVTMAEAGTNRMEFAKKCEFIDIVIDAKAEDCLDQLLAANGGEKYNMIFECVGIEATLNGYLDVLKSGGKLMVLGVPNEMIPFNFNPVVVKNMSVIPSHAWTFEEFKNSLAALTAGEVDLKQFITDIRPFEDIQAVFEDLASGDTKNVKVLLKISG